MEFSGMLRETPATRWNLAVIESTYRKWQEDPASLDSSWRFFFEGFEFGDNRLASPSLDARRQTGVVLLIHAYRDLGHFVAHLDPLGEPRQTHALLELAQFGLDASDL